MHNNCLQFFALSLCLSISVYADDLPTTLPTPSANESPTTIPTTLPVSIDLSSPKSALRTLSRAMEIGDHDAISKVLLARDERDQRIIDALGQFAQAFWRFREAAVYSFGEEGAVYVTGNLKLANRSFLAIDQATELIQGDSAIVSFDAKQNSPALVKVDGSWRMRVNELFDPMQSVRFDLLVTDSIHAIDAMKSVTREMESNYFRTPEDVVQAFLQKLVKKEER